MVSGSLESVFLSLKQGTHNRSEVSSLSAPQRTQNAPPNPIVSPPLIVSPTPARFNPSHVELGIVSPFFFDLG